MDRKEFDERFARIRKLTIAMSIFWVVIGLLALSGIAFTVYKLMVFWGVF